jgi:hypothetical protein
LGSNFNPEEGANRSFSKLFQSDSDKQIAGNPGSDYSCINQGEIMPVTD